MKSCRRILFLLLVFLCATEAGAGGFDENVFIESASLVLVSESQSSLASLFGHSFLKLEGRGKVHALSYYNRSDLTFFSLLDALLGRSEGFFALLPYREMREAYLVKEQRSLWEFKLKLTKEECQALKEHVRVLENRRDRYHFVTNNCNSKMEELLSLSNAEYQKKNMKGFITPLEYSQFLLEHGLVAEITYLPAKKHKDAAMPEVWNYPSSSRLAFSAVKDGVILEASPIYHDKLQAQQYDHEVDLRLLGVSAKFGRSVKIEGIDVFSLTSYETITPSIDIGYHKGLRSMVGLGSTVRMGRLSLYAIPCAGMREGRAMLSARAGAMAKIAGAASLMAEYEDGSDYNMFRAGVNVRLGKNCELQSVYSLKGKEQNIMVSLRMYF